MELLDFRGKACPLPVIGTKKFVDDSAGCLEIGVHVDNMAAAENVQRFLENSGFSVTVSGSDNDFLLTASRVNAAETNSVFSEKVGGNDARTLVLVTSDKLGNGDDVLGKGLIRNFILTLKEMGDSLWRIVLLNSGVKLAVEGSDSLDALSGLEASGVSILVCGTCLNHYNLLEKKKVGETTNMLDVVTSLDNAGKVITVS